MIRTGETELISEIDDAMLVTLARDPEHLQFLREMKATSSLCVPMIVRGQTIGAVTFVMAESKRRYTDKELWSCQEFVRRAASAIDNAWLYQDAQRAISARDEFLSIAAHELKTPLTALSLQMQVLNKILFAIESPKANLFLGPMQHSQQQLDRFIKLVDDILDVSRARSGRLIIEKSKENLSELVGRVAKTYEEELIKLKCSLELHLGPSVIGMVDPVRIEQVLGNLIGNAIKYGTGKPIEITTKVEGSYNILLVRDFGLGIAKEDQARIFNLFERAMSVKNFAGLGLGLYITRQIILAHSGSIQLESELGKGSTFIVKLPA